jgi:RHS repeat-associated protein
VCFGGRSSDLTLLVDGGASAGLRATTGSYHRLCRRPPVRAEDAAAKRHGTPSKRGALRRTLKQSAASEHALGRGPAAQSEHGWTYAWTQLAGHPFTGKEEDVEVGLVYFGKRFLSPALGRWVSPDPLGVHEPGSVDFNLRSDSGRLSACRRVNSPFLCGGSAILPALLASVPVSS